MLIKESDTCYTANDSEISMHAAPRKDPSRSRVTATYYVRKADLGPVLQVTYVPIHLSLAISEAGAPSLDALLRLD
jgi:hypothetical protein